MSRRLVQVQFSSDGNFLFSGARQDPSLMVWDVRYSSGEVYRLHVGTWAVHPYPSVCASTHRPHINATQSVFLSVTACTTRLTLGWTPAYAPAARDRDTAADVRLSCCVLALVRLLVRLQRETATTNQRIQFDIEPCGRHLATGGCDGAVRVGARMKGGPLHAAHVYGLSLV